MVGEAKMAAPSSGMAEQFMHKNRLQEYCQQSAMQLPVYQTINEGSAHAPQFRSTVLIDGAVFKSPSTFSHRKTAEQYVAKVALEGISRKLRNEGIDLIYHEITFCKSILNEYAVKVNLGMPKYVTSLAEGLLPMLVSSAVFDGKTYTSRPAKNKKEAEQLTARIVIESILGSSEKKAVMSQIIKSKSRLYAAVNQGNDPQGSIPSFGGLVEYNSNISHVKGKEVQVIRANDKLHVVPYVGSFPSSLPDNTMAKDSVHAILKTPKQEEVTEQISDSIGNGTCVRTLSRGDPLVRSTSAGLMFVPNASLCNDVQGIPNATAVHPSASNNDDPNSKRKCSEENNEEAQAKKARNEQLPAEVPKGQP